MPLNKSSRLLCLFTLFLSLLLHILLGNLIWAQNVELNPPSFSKQLQAVSERVSEAPIPPPKYLRRLWEWNKAKQRNTPIGGSQDSEISLDPSLLDQIQAELWKALGQASNKPLHESPSSRDQREYEMDLETKGTPILPNYTHEFIPSIAPHKRMTSWNVIKSSGELAVEIGGLTEIESIHMPLLRRCIKSKPGTKPSKTKYLSTGEGLWYSARDLDISCLQSLCFQKGSACFVGIFSTENWSDLTRPRGVASVSPEQSLVSFNQSSAVILSQDDAGNFYLSASPDSPLNSISQIALIITAPRSYFSGSWRSTLSLSELKDHPNLNLPADLQRQALHLSSQLFKYKQNSSKRSFENLMFQLSDYFRAFKPGVQIEQDGSVYERLTLSQIGVCRHRSYAFMVTARALGIPTRYVTNQVHAFVEVLDPSGRWRRVDLGGEGIAPEEKGLTQDLLRDKQQSTANYRPDDGLPRPKNYQSAQREQEALQQNFQSENTEQLNQTKADQEFRPSNSIRPSNVGLTQTESGKQTAFNRNSKSLKQNSSKSKSTHSTVYKQEPTGPVSSNEQATKQSPNEMNNSLEAKKSSLFSQSSNPSEFLTQKQELEDSIKARFDTASCDTPYLNHTKLKQEDQVQALNRLHHLLNQDHTYLNLSNLDLEITLKPLSTTTIHRCDLLRLKGQIKSKSKRGRRKLKYSWVLAALKSKLDGVILSGWGQVNTRGAYDFKAQIPVRMNAGDYQIFVYFPAQKGLAESWSKLE